MDIRSCLVLTLVLWGFLEAPAHAQQMGGVHAAARGALNTQLSPSYPNPYAQPSQGFTSSDNPYAPGGLYDPYGGSRSSGGSTKGGLGSKSKSLKRGALQAAQMGAGSGVSGGYGSTMGQCGSSKHSAGLGTGGAGTTATKINGSPSQCSGGSGLRGNSLSGVTSFSGKGMSSQQGTNGLSQDGGMKQRMQQVQPQTLPH